MLKSFLLRLLGGGLPPPAGFWGKATGEVQRKPLWLTSLSGACFTGVKTLSLDLFDPTSQNRDVGHPSICYAERVLTSLFCYPERSLKPPSLVNQREVLNSLFCYAEKTLG